MKNAIDNLMNEHQLILRVLASFNTLAAELQGGRTVSRQDLADFVTFFREFADKCHHCKEEDQLFVAMNQIGFSKEYGPVAVMLVEHTEGRNHVGELWKIGQQSGPLTPEEIGRVTTHIDQFVPLLSAHIAKEDTILYPMARNAMAAEQLSELDAKCEAFERQVMAPGAVAQLEELAARLIAAYPASPEAVASLSACFSCR